MIARAAAILRALKQNQSGASLGQISEAVALPRSTVQRIVGALQTERLVIADPQGRGVRLGPEVASLAEAARYNVVEACRLLLIELSQATGETADLSVLRGAGMIFLDQAPGTHRLRTVSSVGEVFPLTTTANGRACLAMLDRDKAEALTRDEWARRGIDGDWEAFEAMLDRVRETGLAYDIDEHTPGISAIGVAFRDVAGDLHAISAPAPSTRFEDVRAAVVAALARTSEQVRQMMDAA